MSTAEELYHEASMLPRDERELLAERLLATLERKGYVRHGRDGAKYVFRPILHPQKAGKSAIAHVIQTFFNGSRGRAAAALLDVSPSQLSEEELDELDALIKKARKGGKR